MDDTWDALRRGGEVTIDCQGTAVAVRRGKTNGNSVLDVDWPNGSPRVTVTNDGFDDDTQNGLTRENFEELMKELPSLVAKADAIRKK